MKNRFVFCGFHSNEPPDPGNRIVISSVSSCKNPASTPMKILIAPREWSRFSRLLQSSWQNRYYIFRCESIGDGFPCSSSLEGYLVTTKVKYRWIMRFFFCICGEQVWAKKLDLKGYALDIQAILKQILANVLHGQIEVLWIWSNLHGYLKISLGYGFLWLESVLIRYGCQ